PEHKRYNFRHLPRSGPAYSVSPYARHDYSVAYLSHQILRRSFSRHYLFQPGRPAMGQTLGYRGWRRDLHDPTAISAHGAHTARTDGYTPAYSGARHARNYRAPESRT